MTVELKPPPQMVWVALAGLGVALCASITYFVLSFHIRDLIQLLITLGFIYLVRKGHPLAVHWIVPLGLLVGIVGGELLLALYKMGQLWLGGLVLAQMAGFVTAAVALNMEDSRAWFDLRCPRCRSHKGRPAHPLFRDRQLKCYDCGRRWTLRERPADPATFD